jgi:hypothetical protein
VSNEPWNVLAVSFTESDVEWRIVTLSPEGNEATVRPQLRFETVLQRLNETVSVSGWSSRYRAIGEAVSCELTLGTVTKSALAESTHVDKSTASKDAFVYAAELFGLVPPVNRFETYHTEYDPETKTLLYEPEVGGGLSTSHPQSSEAVSSPTLPPPQETPKSAGQQAIDKLVERLEGEGKGKEVAKLIVQYGGYGQNPEAARELYGKLRALLVDGSSS